jgi:hypothetical protein
MGQLSLDTIANASFHFSSVWTPELKKGQAQHLLQHLLNKLYGASKGNLFHAQVRASHASLGAAIGVSREWVCTLSQRLQACGWIAFRAARLADGKFEIGVFSAGRKLKRLLCMLLGYRKPKHRVNPRPQSFPLSQEEREKSFSSARQQQLEREKKPPSPETLRKAPILEAWLQRGHSTEE